MKLVLSLDLPTYQQNLHLAEKIAQLSAVKEGKIWVKVGFRSFIRDGKKLVEGLKKLAFPIFLDLKLYDIPNTMADSAEEITRLGVDMFNIHLSAGERGIREVMERLERFKSRPIVLGVTLLTSFSADEVRQIYNSGLEKGVELAHIGFIGGIDGVVCSVWESRKIKIATSPDFITLTPGIRPSGTVVGDQKRIATPAEAYREGVDFIVVGRPIYQSTEPVEAVLKILPYLK